MFTPAAPLAIGASQKQHLETLVRAGTTTQRLARRCQVILSASQGAENHAIARQTGLSRLTLLTTRAAFIQGGVEVLRQRLKRKRDGHVLTPAVEQRIVDTTLTMRPASGTHWGVHYTG